MFDWWVGLDTWKKLSVAGGFLLGATIMWASGYIWFWGWAAGGVLLVASIPSRRSSDW